METLYESIVHGLRSKGWTRQDAEDEALERIERNRCKTVLTCGGIGVNYTLTPDGCIKFA